MNIIEQNGVKMEMDGNVIKITLPKKLSGSEDITVTDSKTIEGDVTGNINVTGSNVTITIEGDLVGNVQGAANLTVHGDFIGNKR